MPGMAVFVRLISFTVILSEVARLRARLPDEIRLAQFGLNAERAGERNLCWLLMQSLQL